MGFLLPELLLPLGLAAFETEIRDVNTQQRSLLDTNILYFLHTEYDVGNEKRVVLRNVIFFRGKYFWLAS